MKQEIIKSEKFLNLTSLIANFYSTDVEIICVTILYEDIKWMAIITYQTL